MTVSYLPVVLLSSGAGGGSITDVNLMLFWSTLVLFVLFALIMGRFGWGPLLKVIEDREKSVRDAVEGAQKANADAQALLARHQEMLRDAGREREEIIKKALQEAGRLRDELAGQARTEAEGLVQRAREEIDREMRRALVDIRSQIADLAVDAASKIVVSSLTPTAQKQLVQDFIDQLPPLSQ